MVKNKYNPYVPDTILRWNGSVIPHVIGQTLTVTIITTIVTILHRLNIVNLSIVKTPSASNTFTQIIGIVVGLLLTYRTNTAYDRFWEGRKIWSMMVLHIRNLTRYVWVGVREDDQKKDKSEILIEKRTVLNLLLGFAVAVKHYLREEPGYNYDDLEHLISNIQTKLPGFTPTSTVVSNRKAQKVGWFTHLFHRKLKKYDNEFYSEDHNLPLDITLYLSSYIGIQAEEKRIDVTTTNQLLTATNSLCDCLSQFERILRSPIPLAYAIHLSQTVWIYCISLPFFLVSSSGWATIVIVFFVSLVLFGLEHIGTEIENPFGYDKNDLELDDFCDYLKRELSTISSHPPPSTQDWVYAPENFPFANKDISATEAAKLGPDDVRSLLSVKSDKDDERNSEEIVQEEADLEAIKEDGQKEISEEKNKNDDVHVDVGE